MVELRGGIRHVGHMTRIAVGPHGEIALPDEVRQRYGFEADTPVRVVETRNGVLLIPLSDDAEVSPELQRELAEWQSLSLGAWDAFEYRE